MNAFINGLIDICNKEEKYAEELITKIFNQMDLFWTPFEGHKISKSSTIQKWKDFLIICESGRIDLSEKARLKWFSLECKILSELKDFQA